VGVEATVWIRLIDHVDANGYRGSHWDRGERWKRLISFPWLAATTGRLELWSTAPRQGTLQKDFPMDQKHETTGSQVLAGGGQSGPGDQGLTRDGILTAEFQYIAQSLFQNNEDRARVTSFYLITLGSFIAAIFSSTQISALDPVRAYTAFAILFAILAIMGLLTILQLLRFREAWFDSAAAMNEIKRYYIEHFTGQGLGQAFRWKPDELGPRLKLWSVGFLLALQVAILGGASLGATVLFFGLVASKQAMWMWWPAIIAAVAWAAAQMILYWLVLRKSRADV
jgi:hypothetical protein